MSIKIADLAFSILDAGNGTTYEYQDLLPDVDKNVYAETNSFDELFYTDARSLGYLYQAANSDPLNGYVTLREMKQFLTRYDHNSSGALGGGELRELKHDYSGMFRAMTDIQQQIKKYSESDD